MNIILDKDHDIQYEVVHRNNRYEIEFFTSLIFVPIDRINHELGKFFLNGDKKICFDFHSDCPDEIKSSMLEYYGNGTKFMRFENKLTGEVKGDLDE